MPYQNPACTVYSLIFTKVTDINKPFSPSKCFVVHIKNFTPNCFEFYLNLTITPLQQHHKIAFSLMPWKCNFYYKLFESVYSLSASSISKIAWMRIIFVSKFYYNLPIFLFSYSLHISNVSTLNSFIFSKA